MNAIEGGKILIVEDDKTLSGVLFSIFSKNGYIVKICPDADKAFQILGLMNPYSDSVFFIPDLILLDLALPGVSGKEFIKIVQKSGQELCDIPFIIFSGQYTDDVDMIDGLHMGAVDYICKPFKMEILLYKVRNFIKHYKGNRSTESLDLAHEVFDIKEASAYLRLTEKTVYGLVKSGELPALKIGGQWRFSKESLKSLFHKN